MGASGGSNGSGRDVDANIVRRGRETSLQVARAGIGELGAVFEVMVVVVANGRRCGQECRVRS